MGWQECSHCYRAQGVIHALEKQGGEFIISDGIGRSGRAPKVLTKGDQPSTRFRGITLMATWRREGHDKEASQ